MSVCLFLGVKAFLNDLGLTTQQILGIVDKLEKSYAVYQKNLPEETITDISITLYECIKLNTILGKNEVLYELGKAFIFFVILFMFYIFILIVTLLMCYYSPREKPSCNNCGFIFFIFWLLISILFLAIFYLIYRNTSNTVNLIISRAEADIMACVDNAISEIEFLFAEDKVALKKAICAY